MRALRPKSKIIIALGIAGIAVAVIIAISAPGFALLGLKCVDAWYCHDILVAGVYRRSDWKLEIESIRIGPHHAEEMDRFLVDPKCPLIVSIRGRKIPVGDFTTETVVELGAELREVDSGHVAAIPIEAGAPAPTWERHWIVCYFRNGRLADWSFLTDPSLPPPQGLTFSLNNGSELELPCSRDALVSAFGEPTRERKWEASGF